MNRNYRCYSAGVFDLFSQPSRIIVAGCSNSGKTELVTELVKQYKEKFETVVICGTENHPIKQRNIHPNIVVSPEILDPLQYRYSPSSNILLILDDNYSSAVNSQIVCDSFTKGRHANLSVILITQNLFMNGKKSRDISLNATHFLLLRQRDLSQIEVLGRQLFGKQLASKFVGIYTAAVLKRQPYSYLLVDLDIRTPSEVQFRTDIITTTTTTTTNGHQHVYQWM